MRRLRHVILVCVAVSTIYSVSAYAGTYTLSEDDYPPAEGSVDVTSDLNSWLSAVPDDEINMDQYQAIMGILYPELLEDEDSEDVDEVASPSVASRSQTVRNIVAPLSDPVPASSYNPYESSISTSVVQYMADVLPKLGNVRYVLFRQGQYTYRLVYAEEMTYESGVFTAADAQYISYDSRYYTWAAGAEGAFRLDAGSYMVYSDLGGYPMLDADRVPVMLLAFFAAVFLLFMIYRSLLSPRQMVI